MTQEERRLAVDCSPHPVSIPIISRTPLRQLNFVRGRKIGIDSEVPIVEAIACDTAKTGQAETDQKNRRPFFQAMIAKFRKPGAVFSMKQQSIKGRLLFGGGIPRSCFCAFLQRNQSTAILPIAKNGLDPIFLCR